MLRFCFQAFFPSGLFSDVSFPLWVELLSMQCILSKHRWFQNWTNKQKNQLRTGTQHGLRHSRTGQCRNIICNTKDTFLIFLKNEEWIWRFFLFLNFFSFTTNCFSSDNPDADDYPQIVPDHQESLNRSRICSFFFFLLIREFHLSRVYKLIIC